MRAWDGTYKSARGDRLKGVARVWRVIFTVMTRENPQEPHLHLLALHPYLYPPASLPQLGRDNPDVTVR